MFASTNFVRIFLLLSLLLLFPHDLRTDSLSGWEPEIIRYTSKNGLPTSMVFKVIEDHRGYIWLATNHGAVRYDGHTFRTFTTRDGLMDNTILNMTEDSEGRLWFLSLSKKLSYFKDGRVYPFAANRLLTDRLPYRPSEVHFDDSGTMWLIALSASGVFRYRNDTLTEVDLGVDSRLLNANYLCCRVGDQWMTLPTNKSSTENRLVGQQKDWYALNLIQTSDSRDLYHCQRLSDGTLIASGPRRLVAFDGTGLGRTVHESPQGYLGRTPLEDAQGDLWLQTKSGVYRYRGGISKDTSPEYYLPGTTLTGVLRDRSGNYWFSSWDNGLLCMPGIQFRSLRLSSVQAANTITAIKVYEDRIWFMTSRGSVFILEDDSTPSLFFDGEQRLAPNPESVDFMLDRNDRLWVGQQLHVVTRLSPGKYRNHAVQADASKTMLQMRGGNIIVGTANGVRLFSDDLTPDISFGSPPFGLLERTNALCEDMDSSVWFGTISGLYRFDGSRIRYYGDVHPLLRNRITGITQLKNGSLVLGTWGAGLLIKRKEKVYPIDADSGLASDIVRSVYAENDTAIWVGTNKGLSRITIIEDRSMRYDIVNYTTAKGLPSNGINGIVKHHGHMWLATDDGLCRFHPDSVRMNRLPLPIEITEVAINGDPIGLQSSYELPHDRNNVTVSFIGIGFRTLGDIRYRYRLLGLGEDTAWHETVNRTIPFFSLPSGTYTFQVSAMNEDGAWNPMPKEARFRIAQHYSQTLWFRIGVIAFGLLGIWLVVWRILDNRRRKYAIDAQIGELRQQALSANMNPHFIANALSAVQDYILRHDAYEANEFLARFSRLIRLNLETSLASFVSLEEELERLELYLSLEKLRFGEDLDYHITIDDEIDTDETLVPSMLIQPYIENSIWHGILPAERPGLVEVQATAIDKETYAIVIRDNGIGLSMGRKNASSDRKSLSMGLNRERLNLLSKSLKRSFTIVASDLVDDSGTIRGAIITITLPRDIPSS